MILDNTAPVIQNIPVALTLNCEDPIPEVPMLMATDNCSTIDTVMFNEINTPTGTGSCAAYNYVLTRTWTAIDDCGNTGVGTQTITVRDTTPPDFIVPMDTTFFSCVDISNPAITGSGSNVMDNCSPADMVTVSFLDDTISMQCTHDFVVERNWTAIDECGNRNVQLQTITVRDTTPPTFVVPAEAMASCGQLNNTNITGEPTAVMDDCDANPEVTYVDIFTQGGCANGGTIERQWMVTDACGNATTQSQTIIFTDEGKPSCRNQRQWI